MTPGKQYARQEDGSIKSTTGREQPLEVGGEHQLDRLYDRIATIEWKIPPPQKTNGVFNLTDMGNGERLAERYGHIIRYNYDRKSWLVWNGKVWEWDTGAKVGILAKLTVRSIYHEAGDGSDAERRSKVASHAVKSESDHRIAAMINLAKTEPGIPVNLNELDTNTRTLNCINGTLDLKTGELHKHNPDDMNTVIIPVEYDPKAKCPMWLEFVEWATGKDKDLETYLQRGVGYSLTGDITEQIMFFLYGLGLNGKSTFTMIIQTLLGEYAIRLSADDLMVRDRKQSGPKEGIADLMNKRYVLGSEVRDGRRLDVGLIKDITGGETIKARRLYEHDVTYMPRCKIWLYGNRKPTIADSSLAIWRRMKMIEFKQTVEPDKVDRELAEKLQTELPGILAWAVRGCIDWQNEGFNDAKAVKDATETYRHEQDALRDFITECCSIEPNARELKGELRKHYEAWCIENKVDTLNQKPFKASLEERGITSIRGGHNKAYWRGIRLLTEEEAEAIADQIEKEEATREAEEVLPELPQTPQSPYALGVHEDFSDKPITLVTKVTQVTGTCYVCPNCGGCEYWIGHGKIKKCAKCWTPPESAPIFEDN